MLSNNRVVAKKRKKPIKKEVMPLLRRALPKRTPPPDVVMGWKKRWGKLFPVVLWVHRVFVCRREPILIKTDLYEPGLMKLEPGQMMLWRTEKNTEFYLVNAHRFHTLTPEIVTP